MTNPDEMIARFLADHGTERWLLARIMEAAEDACVADPSPQSYDEPHDDWTAQDYIDGFGARVVDGLWGAGTLEEIGGRLVLQI